MSHYKGLLLLAMAILVLPCSWSSLQAASGPSPQLVGTTPSWSIEGGHSGDYLGRVVSRAGDVNGDGYDDVVIVDPRFDRKGRARLYLGSPTGLSTTAAWSAVGEALGNEFGYAIAGAGDVNGDGYDDVVVGAPFYSSWSGRAYLYEGSPSGLSSSPDWIGECSCPGATFGRAVGPAGDVNGDGFDDVIIGAQGLNVSGSQRGAAYLYAGSPGGLSASPGWSILGPALPAGQYTAFAATVGPAGDVNGDGFDDVVIGAPEYDAVQPDAGKVFVFGGSAAGPQPAPSWTFEGPQQAARLGISAASGDFNGDGYSDLAVGAPFFDGTLLNEGLLEVFHGSPAGLPAAASWSTLGGSESRWLGMSVSGAGDVDGDGYQDLVTGTPSWVVNQRTVGAALIAFGSPTGLPPGPLTVIRTGPNEGSEFGTSVSGAGDVDGDGAGEILVGAPSFTSDITNLDKAGMAAVYSGLASAVDRDGDGGAPMDGDCDDRDPLRSSRPLEAANLVFLDDSTLAWDGQTLPDGSGVAFDLLRSLAADDFVAAAVCVERNDGADTLALDAAGPPPGAAFHYLVRAKNGCRGSTSMGPLGSTPAGTARVGLVCR